MIKKFNIYPLLSFVLVNIFLITPCYALNNREDLFKNALELSESGKFNVAIEKWNRYLENFPDDPAALSNRGNVKLVIGDVEGSIKDQDKAINLNPDEVDPYINRGIAEEALGLWQLAKKDYMFVISKDNKNFSALYNFANVEGSLSTRNPIKPLSLGPNSAITPVLTIESLTLQPIFFK